MCGQNIPVYLMPKTRQAFWASCHLYLLLMKEAFDASTRKRTKQTFCGLSYFDTACLSTVHQCSSGVWWNDCGPVFSLSSSLVVHTKETAQNGVKSLSEVEIGFLTYLWKFKKYFHSAVGGGTLIEIILRISHFTDFTLWEYRFAYF